MSAPAFRVSPALGDVTDLTWVDDDGVSHTVRVPVAVELLDPQRVFDVEFRLVADHNRAIVVDELRVRRRPNGRPVTTSVMRNLPLAGWLAAAIAAASQTHPSALTATATGTAHDATVRVTGSTEADPYLRWRLSPAQATAVRMSDRVLNSVAAVYRCAVSRGEDPTNTVAQVFRKPRSTAGRWVLEARRRGFLAPA